MATAPEVGWRWRPGTEGLKETTRVVRQFTSALRDGSMATRQLWTVTATLDDWADKVAVLGPNAVRAWYAASAKTTHWGRLHALIGEPGLLPDGRTAVLEGSLDRADDPGWRTAVLHLVAVSDGKISAEELYFDGGGHGGLPTPCSGSPSESDGRAAIEAAQSLGDALSYGVRSWLMESPDLFAPDVRFLDITQPRESTGFSAIVEWFAGLPDVRFWPAYSQRPVVGYGWVVLRWSITGRGANGSIVNEPGPTVLEIRGGKIARMTMYYDSRDIKLAQ